MPGADAESEQGSGSGLERWVAIDFETATGRSDSACALGLAVIADGVVSHTRSWLIRPPDNDYWTGNIRVHGIMPEDTEGAPDFGEIWPEVLAVLEDSRLLAHNAPFDTRVLSALLETYALESPAFEYGCTLAMSRRTYPHLHAHKLNVVCDHCGIGLTHHDATSDALACAEVALRCRDVVGALTLAETMPALGLELKRLRVP